MMKRSFLAVVLCVSVVLAVSCKKKEAGENPPATEAPAVKEAPPKNDVAPTPVKEEPKAAADQKIEGFSTPESVIYDEKHDRYLVSNVNGKPTDKDDNGFISTVSTDGKITNLKWIDGAASKEIELNGPKGLAISGNALWVADISAVRKFDLETGKLIASIELVGATFLNDVTPSADGGVLVTDSGLSPEFKPTGTDSVYTIKADNTVDKLFADPSLGAPNGIVADGDGAFVVSFTSGELYRVAKAGKHMVVKAPKGQLDGLILLPDGKVIFSSWEGKNLYIGPKTGPFTELVKDVDAPADINWDSKNKRVLIPLFNQNAIVLHTMP